ncbi:diguanylate phosphodiesterase [Tatumella morbirosei]|uniref:3',5'-cyclic adenosine monophosphate phosphodiesterase CpdA n=1 Tax=Tatumella morbirosei TaxID=642227 RepID=A0A095TDL3_9GAMM|nr:3',5'-cyclic-AMP phosphodiesterase [Tatumella morbirosei]KGD74797.1 diguanylate phosphodiesterase [Tatumella morbirosei]
MDNVLVPGIADDLQIKVLQITDTHLFKGKNETLLGVNTWAGYQAVLDEVIASQQHYDLIIATGDLSQDHSVEAYQHFAEGIQRLPAPCVWLPGNHDFQPAMYDTLAKAGISQSKHVLLGNRWQMLLLDSQVYGVPHGMLSEFQLEWLETALAAYPNRDTVILLHHHPVASGCSWLDQHSLRNSHQLDMILQKYPRAATLLCGHIHQEMDEIWQGRRVLATPSTCVQFKPHCSGFTIDSVAPGWRWLKLGADGQLATQVCRLNTREFLPDMESEGY